MTDTNYTPEEIRLLDMAAMCAISTLTGIPIDDEKATRSYDLAAAMIAERRKRVLLMPTGSLGAAMTPLGTVITTNPPKCVPAPQPQPEQAGKLTEEEIDLWRADARCWQHADAASSKWPFAVSDHEIDRAVTLMREGLRAKQSLERYKRAGNSASPPEASQQLALDLDLAAKLATAERERDTYKRMLDEGAKAVGNAAEKERDEARAEAKRLELHADAVEHSNMLLTARAEKAEAALAEAQPVLDAVAEFGWGTHEKACLARELLANYADRRREQAKGAS